MRCCLHQQFNLIAAFRLPAELHPWQLSREHAKHMCMWWLWSSDMDTLTQLAKLSLAAPKRASLQGQLDIQPCLLCCRPG